MGCHTFGCFLLLAFCCYSVSCDSPPLSEVESRLNPCSGIPPQPSSLSNYQALNEIPILMPVDIKSQKIGNSIAWPCGVDITKIHPCDVIDISWSIYRDGRKLQRLSSNLNGIEVLGKKNNKEFAKTLIIKNLQSSHAGDYHCNVRTRTQSVGYDVKLRLENNFEAEEEAITNRLLLPQYMDWEKREGDAIAWPCGVKINHKTGTFGIRDLFWSEIRNGVPVRIENSMGRIAVQTFGNREELKRILIIEDVQKFDRMEYRCTVQLETGEFIENDIRLRLRREVNGKDFPAFLTLKRDLPAPKEEGDRIVLTCGVDSRKFSSVHPYTNGIAVSDIRDVYWSINGEYGNFERISNTSGRISVNSKIDKRVFNSILTIENLQKSDAIVYECAVSTTRWEYKYLVPLQVVPKLSVADAMISLLPTPSSPQEGQKGKWIEWSCGVNRAHEIASLVDDVFWTRVGESPYRIENSNLTESGRITVSTVRNPKEFNRILTIRDLQESDEAEYQCNVHFTTRNIASLIKLKVVDDSALIYPSGNSRKGLDVRSGTVQ